MAKISSGTMTVTVFAALVGLGGAFVVRQTLHRPATAEASMPKPSPEMVTIPLAATDLQLGRKLTLNDITPRRMTMEQFRKSEFQKLTFLGSTQQIQGRMLRKAVPAGRPFDPGDFFPDGSGMDISERLQAGYRAVTVPIENIGAVNGFAVPGSIVDVLFRAKPEGSRPQVTLTLLERIEVMAFNVNTTAGNRNDPSTSSPISSTVTLAVTPQQAKILKVVEGRGELSLTLRNPKDDFQFAPVEVGMRPDLFDQRDDHQRGILPPVPDDDLQTVPARKPNNTAADVASPSSNEPANGDQLASANNKNKADHELVKEHVDRFVGNASERLTLEDLLGIKPAPKRRTMDIYLGGAKRTINFDEPNLDANADARIPTPLIGNVPSQVPVAGTVQVDRNRLPGRQR